MSDPQPPPPQRLSVFDRALASPVSTFLFALCVAVFFLAERSGSTQDTETLIRFGANYRAGVWSGQWWRLFTSMFLHIGLTHLVWNIWAGFSWTAPFERVLGTGRFLFIYVLSGLVGSATSIIGHEAVSAGASGALFGVMGGVFVLMRYKLGSWRALWNEPSQRQSLVMTALWLLIGPFVGFDSFAHAGGMLAGMGLTAGLVRGGGNRLAVALFCCAVVVAASLRPIPGLHDGWVDTRALRKAVEQKDWPRVVALTEKVEKGDRLLLVRAEGLIELGRGEEAGRLLPTTSTEPDGVLYLASLLERAGQPERARACLQAAQRDAPGSLELQWAEYELLRRQRATDDAEKVAGSIISAHPDSAQGLGLAGLRLMSEGQRDEGTALLAKAVALDPLHWRFEYVMALVDAGRRVEARAAIAGARNADWLECYVLSVDGDFAGNEQVCAALDDSPASRGLKALRLVGLGQCPEALTLLGDQDAGLAKALKTWCAVRADETGRELAALRASLDGGSASIETRVMLFSASRDLADLQGAEDEARNSWMWPLLPDAARQALPR